MKQLIRKWLGLKDTHTTYALKVERLDKPHPKEMELHKKVEALSRKYPDVPLVFAQGVRIGWKKNDNNDVMIHMPDPKTVPLVLNYSILDGSLGELGNSYITLPEQEKV